MLDAFLVADLAFAFAAGENGPALDACYYLVLVFKAFSDPVLELRLPPKELLALTPVFCYFASNSYTLFAVEEP